jgi:hypothetical protein
MIQTALSSTFIIKICGYGEYIDYSIDNTERCVTVVLFALTHTLKTTRNCTSLPATSPNIADGFSKFQVSRPEKIVHKMFIEPTSSVYLHSNGMTFVLQ